jgi:hypothetical protein
MQTRDGFSPLKDRLEKGGKRGVFMELHGVPREEMLRAAMYI